MIISHSKKFIFFACGKTGTTSIEGILKQYHDGDDLFGLIREKAAEIPGHIPKHARPEMVKECIPEEVWNEYFKFVFVRNPWDWVVSQYYFSNFKKKKLDHFTNKVHRRHVEKVWRRLITNNPYDPCESLMQHAYVYDRKGEKSPDFIGCYERLQEDFDQICRYLNIPCVVLPVKNTTTHKPYRELYTWRGRKRVARLYEKDIRLLGYGFNQTPDRDSLNPCWS